MVVNVALPSIQRDLGGGITGLQWVVDGYPLMFAALLLSAGALSDRAGARRAFTAGVYLQQLRGVSSLGTGVAFLPMMLVGAVLTPFSARIAERLGARVGCWPS